MRGMKKRERKAKDMNKNEQMNKGRTRVNIEIQRIKRETDEGDKKEREERKEEIN